MADEPKTNDPFKVVEIAETTKEVIQTPEGEFLDDSLALARILNELKEIRKALS